MCDGSKRVEIMHNAGHNVPSTGVELIAIADAMRESTQIKPGIEKENT